MGSRGLLITLIVALVGCSSSSGDTILDRELQMYQWEQEKYRREDLEELYRQEQARSDELTEEILALREEVARRLDELSDLEDRLEKLNAEIAAARKKVKEAEAKAKPPAKEPPAKKPAEKKPAPAEPAENKPAEPEKTPAPVKPPAKNPK